MIETLDDNYDGSMPAHHVKFNAEMEARAATCQREFQRMNERLQAEVKERRARQRRVERMVA